MWKSLITISIIFGILAGWLRYQTTTDLKHERTAFKDSTNNLNLANKYLTEVEAKNEEHIGKTTQTSDDADTQEAEEASKAKTEEVAALDK